MVAADRARVWEDDFYHLHLSVDGEEFADVRAVSVFPISGKADYVSFLDQEGKEVALLSNPDELDKQSRRTLRKAIEKMYYVAKIRRVYSVTSKMGIKYMQVMTDRGCASFEVVHHDQVRWLPGGRVLITDADGNRFEIENIANLDAPSQSIVRSEI